tara:strand:- start:2081 stop:2461 length:381 start_codon:yes stop_codon:yes gene_type:complete
MKNNLSYTLSEDLPKRKTKQINYDSLKTKIMNTKTQEIVNYEDESMQRYMLLNYEYDEYKKKELEKICDYYDISKRKKRKEELIQDIILFEMEPVNDELVQRRKTLWFYMEEIKSDNYLRKFLILD